MTNNEETMNGAGQGTEPSDRETNPTNEELLKKLEEVEAENHRLKAVEEENRRLKSEASERQSRQGRTRSRSLSRTPSPILRRKRTPQRSLSPIRKKSKKEKWERPRVTITPFGEHPQAERRQAWYTWLDLFESALLLSGEMRQWEKVAFLKAAGGARLGNTISAFGLERPESSRPYDTLIDNISHHFESMTDPTVEEKRIQECRQEPGEAASDFYERLIRVMGHKGNDDDAVKVHFVSRLRDANFQALAAVNGWNLRETVAAASRSEGFKVAAAQSRPIEIAHVGEQRGQGNGAREGRDRRPWERSRGLAGRGGRSSRNNAPGKECDRCMRRHVNGVCKAMEGQCNKCGKKGHFWRACPEAKKSVNEVKAIEPRYD
jgi:hypothetical protein